ncbi:MAG: hypothetical protein Kow0029_02140 [Candidatus Rifleibacteriota bacterium]
MSDSTKNILIKSFCRQCRAAVSSNAAICPLCGISRPNLEKLNTLEKEYLENPPMVPGKYHEMLETVDPKLSLGKNAAREIRNYLTNPAMAYLFMLAFVSMAAGGLMLWANVLFPFSFMLFWVSMVYLGYDTVNFSRAVLTSFLVKRLQMKVGMSPYSVHFKIELQLQKMLQSLQLVINSFFNHDWQNQSQESMANAESFLSAAKTIAERIQKYARLSLDTITLIWRNNVYAIVAMNDSLQDKAVAIGNKIKEAEALIIRYKWLMSLNQIGLILQDYTSGKKLADAPENSSYCQFLQDKFLLSPYGPISEPYAGNFQHVPYEIPFLMRFFWHQQLPPFPLESQDLTNEFPELADFFESIQQVRKLKAKLEEQMVLDCAQNAISEVSALDKTGSVALEAEELKRFQLYSKFLDIPKFQPDSQELQNKIDRLRAEMRVTLGTDN